MKKFLFWGFSILTVGIVTYVGDVNLEPEHKLEVVPLKN